MTEANGFDAMRQVGVQRCYVWFGDGASPASVQGFSRTVIAESPRT